MPSHPLRTTIATLAVATALLLAGCAAAPPVTPSPTRSGGPTPTAIASSSVPTASASGDLPDPLRYLWVGDTRGIAGLIPPAIQSGMKFGVREMGYWAQGTGEPILESTASFIRPNMIEVLLDDDGAGWHAGDRGTYRFSTSSSGRAMSLQTVAEGCASRAIAMAGDWDRVACPDPQGWCLGDLDAGPHRSAAWNPWTPPASPKYDYGRFAYTVPDGWANDEDGRDGYLLVQQDAPPGTDAIPGPSIRLFQDVLPSSQAVGCQRQPALGVGHSPREFAAWLASLPYLIATRPHALRIGGLDGFMLDLSIDPKTKHTCPWLDPAPSAALFLNSDPSPDAMQWGTPGYGWMRLIFLDLGDGRTLLIDIEAPDRATWDALVAGAMPIVQSFRFHH